jgi:CRP-like cAMP-binding protein
MNKNKTPHNISALKDISMFLGIKNITLKNIFSNSKFINFKKGNNFFLQGEIADYVYIVIKGSVRIFQSNKDGEEIALKIVKNGDSFLEAITFSSKNYPASSQVVEDAVVCSIPISILQKNIQQDNNLAMNMLVIAGKTSQELITKIEQLTLKTTTQRIGWYILRLFIEKKWKNKTIELPYDKSLIASYLNMKPETLSRSLKQLKKQGINIQNNIVSISDGFALCNYCNPDVNKDCNQSNHNQCKYSNSLAP